MRQFVVMMTSLCGAVSAEEVMPIEPEATEEYIRNQVELLEGTVRVNQPLERSGNGAGSFLVEE